METASGNLTILFSTLNTFKCFWKGVPFTVYNIKILPNQIKLTIAADTDNHIVTDLFNFGIKLKSK